jgi:hypothetical protein
MPHPMLRSIRIAAVLDVCRGGLLQTDPQERTQNPTASSTHWQPDRLCSSGHCRMPRHLQYVTAK